ncbi:endonuclease G [Ereboglobus sp. PH5-10]|nr:endonuclease G [Ereboglobus sp. PH5-10]
MARGKSRKKTRNRGRMNLRRLIVCGLVVFGLLGGVAIWHRLAPPATRERIESVTLNVIDLARENRSMPRELVFWLDLLSDKIPLARGKTVAPGVTIESDLMVLGGTPASPEPLDFLQNKGYLAGYDNNHRNPAWVAYRVFPPKYKSGRRPDKFEPDPRTRAKVRSSAYSNSGYDRGHMAPNRAIAVCHGGEAQVETFLMSNVVPQLHGLNAAFWEAMEARVIERYTRRFGQVWVMCGPVYEAGKTPVKIGSDVSVPDAFFLIISTHEKDASNKDITDTGLMRTEAFLVPHRAIAAKEAPSKYLASVREIEQRTGLDFFPLFSSEVQDALESEPAKRAW